MRAPGSRPSRAPGFASRQGAKAFPASLPALFSLLAVSVGCGLHAGRSIPDASAPSDAATIPDGTSNIFLQGCPEEGRSTARRITQPGPGMEGPDALGGEGDYLIMNTQAAYIIQSPDLVKTYHHYGGLPIDAVALDGCYQAGPERFGELGLMVVRPQISELEQSTVRTFRGDTVEIINDGSDGGAAVIRVRGTDDRYWMVEYELIKAAYLEGSPKPLSEPFGLDITVDYILEPESPVLRAQATVRNLEDGSRRLLLGIILLFGKSIDSYFFARNKTDIAGYTLDYGLPWLAATRGDGAWAFSMLEANMTTVDIAGVEVLADLEHFFHPIELQPAGSNDTATATFLLSVGPASLNSAVRHLHQVNPEPIPNLPYELHPISGRVVAAESGSPLPSVFVQVQLQSVQGEWRTADGFHTDLQGRFEGEIPDLGDPEQDVRLFVHMEGRPDPEPLVFRLSDPPDLEISVLPGGLLAHDIRDGSGRPLPAKITLWREGTVYRRVYALAAPGETELPPGLYDVSVTRGFEYSVHQSTVEITAGGTTSLDVVLEHLVDTTGFMSMDGHVHASPSPDSAVLVPHRIATAAVEGLEVLVSTDHESISDWSSGIGETGLNGWLVTVMGQEVTASIPEHTNIYGVPPSDEPRGGFVRWYGLDIAQIYAAERERGAQIIALNHPRNGCNYLCVMGYDRITGLPTLSDPTQIGLSADAALWSWEFDVIELMNGNADPFLDPSRPERTGLFEDWTSFLNLGHKVTAVANTDVHGYDCPGSPRTYFESSTDDPAMFEEAELVAAIKEGRALASTGAFARVRADGLATMGDTLSTQDATVLLDVHIEAIPEIDVTYFMVFVNCDEVLKIQTQEPTQLIKHHGIVEVPVTRDSHIIVMGFGQDYLPPGLKQFSAARIPRFMTNAIYVDRDGNGAYDPPGGKLCSYTIGSP